MSATTSLARRSRAGQLTEQTLSHFGTAGQPAHQLVVFEGTDLAGGNGGRGRRARPGIEQGQLAEHLAGTEHGEQVLPSGRTAAAELDLAADHDVQPILGVALMEQHLPLGQL